MIEIRFFGQITDLTKTEKVMIEDIRDTDAMMKKIIEMYPALANATFKVAVNNKLVYDNIEIAENSIIAFMPPFSGG